MTCIAANRNDFVIPANAGIQSLGFFDITRRWIPAFAGMTV